MTPVSLLTPRNSLRFYIRSVDDLHVLLTCVGGCDRWWDAASIAAATGMSAALAQRALETLARHNLLDVRITEALRYRFHPASPDVEQGAYIVTDAYQKNPLAVTHFVGALAGRNTRDVDDPFSIRRDDDS